MRTAIGAPEPGDEGSSGKQGDIADILARGKVLKPEQPAQAREIQERTGADLKAILQEQFGVPAFRVLQAEAFLNNMRAVDLAQFPPEQSAVPLVPARLARRCQAVPVARIKDLAGADTLIVAVVDAQTPLEEIRMACGMKVKPMLAAAEQVRAALDHHYGAAAD